MALPSGCPPRLYSLMSGCWAYEPHKRPTFQQLKQALANIKDEERSQGQGESRRQEAASRRLQVSTGAQETGQEEGQVTSYLVATSPEVLSQLLRENEARGLEFNPALYTAPATQLNTAKVDFAPAPAPAGHPPPSPYTPRSGRARQISGAGAASSLERTAPRSLPGSAQSTLSRSPYLSGLRRKPSFGAGSAAFNSSSCQVTASASSHPLPAAALTASASSLSLHSLHFSASFGLFSEYNAPHVVFSASLCFSRRGNCLFLIIRFFSSLML